MPAPTGRVQWLPSPAEKLPVMIGVLLMYQPSERL